MAASRRAGYVTGVFQRPGLIAWQGLTLTAVVLPLFSSMLLSGIAARCMARSTPCRVGAAAAGLSSSVGMTMAGLFSWLGATLYETEPALIMVCFGEASVLCSAVARTSRADCRDATGVVDAETSIPCH